METYTTLKPMVDNPGFEKQREKALIKLDLNIIDAPLKNLIANFAEIPYCFTQQCCYGHFLYENQKAERNLMPLPDDLERIDVEYRLAYLALCIQNNEPGERLLQELENVVSIDPDYIQFGCADWFWEQQVNSYALQVSPDRFKDVDSMYLALEEARHIEKIKSKVYDKLNELMELKLNELS